MRKLMNLVLDLLFPPRCPFCRVILKDYEQALCRSCRKELPWTRGSAQIQQFRHVESCVSPLYYEGSVRDSLLRYKFAGLFRYASDYAELMKQALEENTLAFDVITWVPVSEKRMKKRGYDQGKLLAEEISRLTEKPCERLLIKTSDNPAQSSLKSAEDRKKNVKGVYRPTDLASINGKEILLVDDIATTGATLNECARVLKQAGAKEVNAVTVARSRYDR